MVSLLLGLSTTPGSLDQLFPGAGKGKPQAGCSLETPATPPLAPKG